MTLGRHRAGPAWLAAASALILAPDVTPPLLLVNESRSVPTGLYVRTPGAAIGPGRLVAIAQPTAARPYLAGLGAPADMRLLKRVAAVGGEQVCASQGRLRTPRRQIPVPARDRRGTALPVWTGCRTLADGEILLLGDSPNSFDSRHFGPVLRADVEATYREVLSW